jgi:hypothetical protein
MTWRCLGSRRRFVIPACLRPVVRMKHRLRRRERRFETCRTLEPEPRPERFERRRSPTVAGPSNSSSAAQAAGAWSSHPTGRRGRADARFENPGQPGLSPHRLACQFRLDEFGQVIVASTISKTGCVALAQSSSRGGVGLWSRRRRIGAARSPRAGRRPPRRRGCVPDRRRSGPGGARRPPSHS